MALCELLHTTVALRVPAFSMWGAMRGQTWQHWEICAVQNSSRRDGLGQRLSDCGFWLNSCGMCLARSESLAAWALSW